jgi:hypothetical protein
MNTSLALLASTVTVAVMAGMGALACGGSGSSSSSGSSEYPVFNDAADDTYDPLVDGASPPDVAAEAAATQAFVRLAVWSPDEAAVDFCVAPHGTASYVGPFVAQLAASAGTGPADAEAGPAGVSFPQVSAYVALAPQRVDVTIIAAGSGSCAGGSLQATTLPALTAGSYTTLAIVGDAQPAASDPGLSLVAFGDDTGVPAPAPGAWLRFINASPSLPSVDFGTGSEQNANFQSLFSGVPFGQTGTQGATDAGAVDVNGYLASLPSTGTVMSAHASTGASDVAVADGVDFGFGSVTTIALVGGKSGDVAEPAQLIQCADGAIAGWLSACAAISP